MEIDITDFVNDADFFEFSASQMERGSNVGPETWSNAVAEGTRKPLLTTPEQLTALREYVKDFGAWSEEEIAAWSDTECNALFIQLISGDLREMEALCSDDSGAIDWEKAYKLSEKGTISGNIYRGDIEGSDGFNRIFYYVGS